jgi:hypothetical protein
MSYQVGVLCGSILGHRGKGEAPLMFFVEDKQLTTEAVSEVAITLLHNYMAVDGKSVDHRNKSDLDPSHVPRTESRARVDRSNVNHLGNLNDTSESLHVHQDTIYFFNLSDA